MRSRGLAGAPPARLLDGAQATWVAMLEAIEGAQRSIHLEVYAFSHRGIGARFLEALVRAAERAVQVSVVVDAWGSLGSSARVVARLRAAGVRARVHNPLALGLLGRFARNHRKLLLVDGRVAIVGGINLGDEYAAWQDLAIEVRGPVCRALERRLDGEHFVAQDGPVRVHLSRVGGGLRLRRLYAKAFAAARERLMVAHGYFLPDGKLVRRLVAAARRGVRVSVLLPGRSDVPLAHAAASSLAARLQRAGVALRVWWPSVLHAKMAVVDGKRLLLGSFNLDPFSLSMMEALVVVDDAGLAGEAERWIAQRLAAGRAPEVGSAWARLLAGVGRLVVVLARAIAWLLRR